MLRGNRRIRTGAPALAGQTASGTGDDGGAAALAAHHLGRGELGGSADSP